MTYIVYSKNAETGRVNRISAHETLRGAKISRAAAQKREDARWGAQSKAAILQIADSETYRTEVCGKIMVRNLMSGAMVEEAADTPYYCSVSSESYWSN
jgi:hypothetical protein